MGISMHFADVQCEILILKLKPAFNKKYISAHPLNTQPWKEQHMLLYNSTSFTPLIQNNPTALLVVCYGFSLDTQINI